MKGKAVIVAESLETGVRLEKIVREAEYRVVARFISPQPLLEAARALTKRSSWDLVLMELSASDWNGVDLSRTLREILPQISILLFTDLSAPEAAEAADPDLEEDDVSLPPAAWEMLCRLRSLTDSPRESPPAPTGKRRRPSSFDLSRLIRKKRS